MLVGYCRVSTEHQSLDKYVDMLADAGVDKRNIYKEKITGKHRDRPELNKMIGELVAGDVVVIPDLTRLGRSVKDLYTIVGQIHGANAHIKSIRESWLNTEDAQGRLLFAIFSGIAEFESSLISERTKIGLAASKARGRSGGRPSKRTEKAASVQVLYNGGMKIVDIVKQTELSRATVNRIVKDMKDSQMNDESRP
ncbi:MAG: recombinase family protein [Oscillospiraceae bacterium]|nr:recombinase family protein [Oscillospiraceae bacterium]